MQQLTARACAATPPPHTHTQSELEAEISKEEKQAQRLEWLLHRVSLHSVRRSLLRSVCCKLLRCAHDFAGALHTRCCACRGLLALTLPPACHTHIYQPQVRADYAYFTALDSMNSD